IVENRAEEEQCFPRALLRRKADADANGVTQTVWGDFRSGEANRARDPPVETDQRLGELRAPGAHQAADAEDLAAPDGEADILDLVGGEMIDREQRLAGSAARTPEETAEVASDH